MLDKDMKELTESLDFSYKMKYIDFSLYKVKFKNFESYDFSKAGEDGMIIIKNFISMFLYALFLMLLINNVQENILFLSFFLLIAIIAFPIFYYIIGSFFFYGLMIYSYFLSYILFPKILYSYYQKKNKKYFLITHKYNLSLKNSILYYTKEKYAEYFSIDYEDIGITEKQFQIIGNITNNIGFFIFSLFLSPLVISFIK